MKNKSKGKKVFVLALYLFTFLILGYHLYHFTIVFGIDPKIRGLVGLLSLFIIALLHMVRSLIMESKDVYPYIWDFHKGEENE